MLGSKPSHFARAIYGRGKSLGSHLIIKLEHHPTLVLIAQVHSALGILRDVGEIYQYGGGLMCGRRNDTSSPS